MAKLSSFFDEDDTDTDTDAGEAPAPFTPAVTAATVAAPKRTKTRAATAPATAPPEPETPASGHLRLDPARVALNPFNPPSRYVNTSKLATMENLGQAQPVGVCTVERWRELFPASDERYTAKAAMVGDVDWVVIGGSRRTYVAQRDGMQYIEAVDQTDKLTDSASYLALAHVENERENPDLITQAYQIEALVLDLGTGPKGRGGGVKAAARLKKSEGWISDIRSLTNLVGEVRDAVAADSVPLREAVKLANLDPSAQAQAWRDWRARTARQDIARVKAEQLDARGAGEPDTDEADAPTPAPAPKPRTRWAITPKTTPEEAAALVLDRYTGDELALFVRVIESRRASG